MKSLLLLSLQIAFVACLAAADPATPKLVLRPIPGLDMTQLLEDVAEPLVAPETETKTVPAIVPLPSANPEQARVIYIHRRATLPPELTKDLPKAEAVKTGSSASQHLQVKQGTIKIIPKSEAAHLLAPKS